MAKISKKSFVNMGAAQIGKMKASELRSLLRGVRQLWNAQASMFNKYEDTVYSGAYEKMREYYDEHGVEKMVKRGGIEFYSQEPKPVSKMNVNQMRGELFRLQEFFESKTSTVPGARSVTKDMATRIFGADKRGRPKRNLSKDEWAKFWDIYYDYKAQRPADVQEQSNVVQQYLGDVVIERLNAFGDFKSGQAIIDEVKDLFARRSSMEMDVTYDSNSVLSGTRPNQ